MSVPTRDDKKTYLGVDGVPTNDTDPYGGAIDTGALVNENTLGNLFGAIRLGQVDDAFYTAFHIKMEHTSPGILDLARVCNRAGARVNTSSGNAALISTNAADVGQIIVTGKVSGTWVQETLTLNGTTPVVGTQVWDANSVYRWEHISGVPAGLVTCSVNSSTCGVIWGTDNDPSDGFPSIATYMATAEIEFALATSKNAAVSGTNRKTAPASGIGSFSTATKWPGEDFSINVPTNEMEADDSIAVAVKVLALANVPAPAGGKLQFKHNLVGDAKAS